MWGDDGERWERLFGDPFPGVKELKKKKRNERGIISTKVYFVSGSIVWCQGEYLSIFSLSFFLTLHIWSLKIYIFTYTKTQKIIQLPKDFDILGHVYFSCILLMSKHRPSKWKFPHLVKFIHIFTLTPWAVLRPVVLKFCFQPLKANTKTSWSIFAEQRRHGWFS